MPDQLTDLQERIEAIKQRLSQATPGPWQAEADQSMTPYTPSQKDWYVKPSPEVRAERGLFAVCRIGVFEDAICQVDAELIAHAPDDLRFLLAEIDRLEAWVSDLQSGMYVNCVYCGHRYGPGETTPVSMADALKAHIEQCPEHPMSKLKVENAELNKRLTDFIDEVWRIARDGTLGEWDYPDQVLRHLKERIDDQNTGQAHPFHMG